MAFLNWVGEHAFLSVVLLVVFGEILIRALQSGGSQND
jgi:hypothetical protein